MTEYYIDPTWTGTNSGTFPEPYDTISQLTLSSNDSVYFKRGTILTMDGVTDNQRFLISAKSNITVGAYYSRNGSPAYDDDTNLAKPVIQNYASITTSFVEDSPDHWVYDTSNTSPVLIGLGALGTWSPRRKYNTDPFDTYGQWNMGGFGGAGDNQDLWIYSDNDPTTDYGTIYWSRYAGGYCIRIGESSTNVHIENLHFQYAAIGITINTVDGHTNDQVTIQNCDFSYCFRGIVLGGGGTGKVTNTVIANNTLDECGRTGISVEVGLQDNDNSFIISGNTVNNTGAAESIGAIYGWIGTDMLGNIVIENNTVNNVYDVTDYWPNEQHGIYLDAESKNVIVRHNYVTGTGDAAYHSNTGIGPNYWYSNIAVNCPKGFSTTDSLDESASEIYVYNNTFFDVVNGVNISRPDSTDPGSVNLYNNIMYGDGTGNGIALDGNSDDTSTFIYNDHNCIYNFNNPMTRGGSPSGLQNSPGSNTLQEDPLLDDDFYPSSLSPCLDVGMLPYSKYDAYSRLNYGNHIGAVWPKINTSKIRRNM
jgi:hypothetical protein